MTKSDTEAFAFGRFSLLGLGALLLSACGTTMLPIDGFGDDGGPAAGRVSAGIGGAAGSRPMGAGRGAAGSAAASGSTGMRMQPVTMPPRRTEPPPVVAVDAGGMVVDGGVAPGSRDAGTSRFPDAATSGNRECPGGVFEGSLFITSLSETARLRGCTRITGDLNISILDAAEVTGLESLEIVDGTLTVGPSFDEMGFISPIKSLSGLARVRQANGLKLWALSVPSLRELASLREVRTLEIGNLDQLGDLAGLENLSWQLASIMENDQLRSVQGLNVPATVDGIQIGTNQVLRDIGNLATLQTAGSVMLQQLPALTELKGLSGLREVQAILSISDCTGLIDLSGIGAFKTTGTIEIVRNTQLRSLNGLKVMGQPEMVIIEDSPTLTDLTGVFNSDLTGIGMLRLSGLSKLTTLQGLSGLSKVNDVTIERCDNLSNLVGLEMVPRLTSLAVADCVALQTLQGLDSLDHVDGSLMVAQVPALTTLQGAPKLTRLTALMIEGAPKLRGLEGLEAVTQLGTLGLGNNAGLQSLRGLERLTQLDELALVNNNALEDLTALAGVTGLRQLTLTSNGSLENLLGLNVQWLDGLDVTGNASLTSLTGLDKVTSNLSAMIIGSNAALISLRALAASRAASFAIVSDNRSLPQCEVDWLGAHWGAAILSMGNSPAGVCPQ